MLNLRSKLHLAIRPARKSSSSSGRRDSAAAAGQTTAAPAPQALLSLACLPAELLRKIAACCDLLDILALRGTCRAIRDGVDDAAVYAGSLRVHMLPFTSRYVMGRDALVEALRAQLAGYDEAMRIWAALALAVERRLHLRSRVKAVLLSVLKTCQVQEDDADPPVGPEVVEELESRIAVLSTLLVVGYSDLCDLETSTHLMALNNWRTKQRLWREPRLVENRQLSLGIAFSMVMGVLQPPPWTLAGGEHDRRMKELAARVAAEYHAHGLSHPSAAFASTWDGLQTRSLQLAGVMAYLLRAKGQEDLPRADRIPLLDASRYGAGGGGEEEEEGGEADGDAAAQAAPKLPLLDRGRGRASRLATAGRSWQEWYTGRAQELAGSIDEGDWYGYYVYSLELGAATDPAMEDIRFEASPPPAGRKRSSATSASAAPPSSPAGGPAPPPPPAGGGHRRLAARGCKDGVTRGFNLVGTMSAPGGVVSLEKQYVGAHSWVYEGVMTPVGILGEWGRPTGMMGYFWLWRRSWVDPAVEVKTLPYY